MKKEKQKVVGDSSLRQKAEEKIKKHSEKGFLPEQDPHGVEMQRLIHELEVHQIELEMQNLELQKAAEKATTATELDDFAPT